MPKCEVSGPTSGGPAPAVGSTGYGWVSRRLFDSTGNQTVETLGGNITTIGYLPKTIHHLNWANHSFNSG